MTIMPLWTKDETFKRAIAITLQNEGGYVKNPNDRGGETNYGISRRAYPKLDIRNLTKEFATSLYYQDYWLRYKCARIEYVPLAVKFFDSVVMSPDGAIKCIQRACRCLGKPLTEDGKFGPKTWETINSLDGEILLYAYRSELAGRLRSIAFMSKVRREYDEDALDQMVFIDGWLKRAYQ